MSAEKKRISGNVTIILLGLLSVMLLLVLAFSKRMSSHTRLLTLSDYTQINRYFLESYAGDVLQQLRYAVNSTEDEHKETYEAFRSFTTGIKPENGDSPVAAPSGFYTCSDELKELAKELDIKVITPPDISFVESGELEYPDSIELSSDKMQEKTAFIELECKCEFKKRTYTLKIQHPVKVVLRMTPVLKDFFLYVSDFAQEQRNPPISDDINFLYTKNGLPEQEINESEYKPMVLLPPLDPEEYLDATKSGKVFLGPSKKPIYFNLTSQMNDDAITSKSDTDIDPNTKASYGELFTIPPTAFSEIKDDIGLYGIGPFLMRKDGSTWINLYRFEVPLQEASQKAKMGFLGFSDEARENGDNSVFSDSAYSIEEFLNTGDSANDYWAKLEKDKDKVAYSSALKPYGLDPGNDFLSNFSMLNREIYGKVFCRFMLLTFWELPGALGGRALQYDRYRQDTNLSQQIGQGYVYYFRPKTGAKYSDFMSRMVSGDDCSNITESDSSHMAYNTNLNYSNPDEPYPEKKLLDKNDLKTNDGFTAKKDLEEIGKDWFSETEASGISGRIGRAYTDEDEFKEAVGFNDSPQKFKVDGIVYVKGDLYLDDLTMQNSDIGGGVVLVEKNITLRNITRGESVTSSGLKMELGTSKQNLYFDANSTAKKKYAQWKKEIDQDNFLTFVSLKGSINVIGNTLLGVHLISLGISGTISWNGSGNLTVLGGMAVKQLNLKTAAKNFSSYANDCSRHLEAPFFLYHSAMASDEAKTVVQINENMRSYSLTSDKTSGGGSGDDNE